MFKKILLSTLMLCIIFLSCSCSSKTTTSTKFDDNFWSKKGELWIGLNTIISDPSKKETSQLTIISDDMRDYQKTLIVELNGKLQDYFLTVYKVDISDKLKTQKIKFFKDNQVATTKSWTGGYFLPEDPSTIYLSELLLHDNRSQFQNVYIREVMYSIGIHSSYNLYLLDEGFADNEAEAFCNFEKLSYSSIGNYSFVKGLACQMKIANPDLIKNYISISNFSIVDEINSKLNGIEEPYINIKNPGNELQSYIEGFLSPESYSHDNYSIWLSFQAQEIVANYCKQFKLNDSQISKIRKDYVFESYELVKIYKDNDEYKFK